MRNYRENHTCVRSGFMVGWLCRLPFRRAKPRDVGHEPRVAEGPGEREGEREVEQPEAMQVGEREHPATDEPGYNDYALPWESHVGLDETTALDTRERRDPSLGAGPFRVAKAVLPRRLGGIAVRTPEPVSQVRHNG